MQYDVIISGGSFAGLAAVQLHGKRVLLVEPHTIGAVQTSACGTLLAILETTGMMESLLQVHDRILVHLGGRTFDYRVFCPRILAQSDVEILYGSVLGHDGHKVSTTRGVIQAEILIDATGWRGALATNLRRQQVKPHNGRSFGLETTIPAAEDGLHFYYEPRHLRPFNVGWLFLIGGSSRVGLGSYLGRTQLTKRLASFTRYKFGLPPDGRHGGFCPYQHQPASTNDVF